MALSPFTIRPPRGLARWVEAVTGRLTNAYGPALALTLAALTAGCATNEPLGGPLSLEVSAPTPRAALSRIAAGAARCWTKGRIADYAVIPELDTAAGNPRILLIEKGKSGALPSLVIEGDSDPTRLRSFGPLATDRLANRINADIIRWSTGASGCGGRA